MNTPSDLLPDYSEPGIARRLSRLFLGLRQPRGTRAYKEAVIELQRLSAPLAACLLPLLAVLLLMLLSAGQRREDEFTVRIADGFETPPPLTPLPKAENAPEKPQVVSIEVDVGDVRPADPVAEQPLADPASAPTFTGVQRVISPAIFAGMPALPRGAAVRGKLLADKGGSPETEDAVMRALRWLKKNQQRDGSWNQNKIAMTALAVLTYLSHDERPGSSPEFGDTVQRALEHLLAAQNKSTGRLPGNYDHPIATYALCEAYAMTRNPNVKAAALAALGPLISGQHPTGGWTYNMDPGVDKETGSYRDDTSYMGWCAQALKAARMAGLNPEGLDKACKLAVRGFKKNAASGGGFGYTAPGAGGLTGVGTLCMQLLGAADEREVRKSLDLMASWQPGFEAKGPMGGSLQYYFYYATQAKFHEEGKRWDAWNDAMKRVYVKAQQIERNAVTDAAGRTCDIGWWVNGDAHSDRPVMDTCLAALQLMVYYRYLQTTTFAAVSVEPELRASATDAGDIRVEVPLNL
jgi:hypothetical protein